MKAARPLPVLLSLASIAFGLSSCANTSTSGSTAPTITNTPVPGVNNVQVVLTIPPSWHPMLEDRTDDAFVSHMGDVFRQEGFQGNIVDVRSPDRPNPNLPILSINLLDWRMAPIGNINCDFGAAVQTSSSIQQLGVFNGMAIRWMEGPGRFGLADTFGAAADDALRQLYRSIARTQLVPGFVSR